MATRRSAGRQECDVEDGRREDMWLNEERESMHGRSGVRIFGKTSQ